MIRGCGRGVAPSQETRRGCRTDADGVGRVSGQPVQLGRAGSSHAIRAKQKPAELAGVVLFVMLGRAEQDGKRQQEQQGDIIHAITSNAIVSHPGGVVKGICAGFA